MSARSLRSSERRDALGVRRESEIGEHFVGENGQAEGLETLPFGALEVRASGIVGIHDDNGAGARRDGAGERGKIDVPDAVVAQGILAHGYGFHGGQVVEQRIGWARDQDFVAGVGEQLEQVAVSFAGAGSEQDTRSGDFDAALGVVFRDGFARGEQATWVGIVT